MQQVSLAVIRYHEILITFQGFGNRISWDDHDIPAGHTMSFKHALHIASSQLIFKVIMPQWLPSFTASMRETRAAYAELKVRLLLLFSPFHSHSDA